jgi:ADP-ribose pyrophosphatase
MNYRIELFGRDIAYSGFLTMARYRLRHSLYSGGHSSICERECLETADAAAVMLYDPILDQVVMVEQFRIGAMAFGRGAWLVEPAGGVVAPDCDPARAGLREVSEETGCLAWDIELIANFYVSPGFTNQRLHLFCALTDASAAAGHHGLLAEGEDTRVVVLDADHAIAGIGTGRMDTMPAIMALQWLALNRQRLRAFAG